MPTAGIPEMETGKYELNLSVPQLGLLTRLLMESCFNQKPVHKQLAERMAKVFMTKKAGHNNSIASESLLSKFYTFDSATKEIVKDILIRMLNRLKGL